MKPRNEIYERIMRHISPKVRRVINEVFQEDMDEEVTYSVCVDGMETGRSYATIEDAREAAEWLFGKGEDGEITIIDNITGEIVDEFV